MLDTLKQLVTVNPQNYSNVACMLDSMSIKKQIIYDEHTKKMTGFVNLGNETEEEEEATEALVVMIVGLRGHWKAPVAYYLTHSLSAITHKL